MMLNRLLLRKHYVICILFAGLVLLIGPGATNTCQAQQNDSKADSLLLQLGEKQTDTSRVRLFLELSKHYESRESGKSLEYALQAFELSEKMDDKEIQARTNLQLGSAYLNKSDYANALKQYLASLNLYEEIKDFRGKASALSNIGTMYYYQRQIPNAISYWEQALAIEETLSDGEGNLPASYNNLAVGYYKLGEKDRSIEYFFKSYGIFEKLGNTSGMATVLNNIGGIYKEMAAELPQSQRVKRNTLFLQARNNYQKSFDLREQLGDQKGMAVVLYNLGEVHFSESDFKKALEYMLRSEALSKEAQDYFGLTTRLRRLAAVYYELGSYQNAFEYRQKFFHLHDSLFNEKVSADLAALQAQYDAEKQKHTIEMYQTDALYKQTVIKRNQTVLISSGGAIVILFLILLLLRHAEQQKKKNNEALEQSNHEIAMQTEEIMSQKDHLDKLNSAIRKQTDEIMIQRNTIEEKNLILETVFRDITERSKILESDLELARSMQNEMMPSETELHKLLGRHLLIHLSKDQLSGDFYWVASKGEYVYVAVADCTGHGIPGAFLSNLGINLLDRALFSYGLTEPGRILESLHAGVLRAFQKPEEADRFAMYEGMDIGLIRWHSVRKEIVYAGARRPLLWLDSEGFHEVKGKKMSIGGYSKADNGHFPDTHLEINPEAFVFLFSDGITDQLNALGKKLGAECIKNLLKENHSKGFEAQRTAIIEKFIAFKAEEPQTDDVCMLGFQLKNL